MLITLGAGIAIAGIWLAVGLVGLKNGGAAIGVGFFACIATAYVCGAGV